MALKDKKWFQTLTGIAPMIATALGGPFGGIAAAAIKAATGKSTTEVEAAIEAGDMDTLKALKDAEVEFKVKMRELGIREDQLYLQDVADARARHIAVKDKMPAVLAILGWMQWVLVLVVILFGDKIGITFAEQQRDILFFVLATAQAMALQGFYFYLGSSRGSKDKTEAFSRYLMNGTGKG
jgi:hypothetical protein